MRRLIALSGLLILGAAAARAETPAEILCASYKSAIAKEGDAGKKDAMIKALPHGARVRRPYARAPCRRSRAAGP